MIIIVIETILIDLNCGCEKSNEALFQINVILSLLKEVFKVF
jgi:hypothetical protein